MYSYLPSQHDSTRLTVFVKFQLALFIIGELLFFVLDTSLIKIISFFTNNGTNLFLFQQIQVGLKMDSLARSRNDLLDSISYSTRASRSFPNAANAYSKHLVLTTVVPQHSLKDNLINSNIY